MRKSFEHSRLHDSDEILEIGVLPKTLAVGAGVIDAEYAGTFNALGVESTSDRRGHSLLSFLVKGERESPARALRGTTRAGRSSGTRPAC